MDSGRRRMAWLRLARQWLIRRGRPAAATRPTRSRRRGGRPDPYLVERPGRRHRRSRRVSTACTASRRPSRRYRADRRRRRHRRVRGTRPGGLRTVPAAPASLLRHTVGTGRRGGRVRRDVLGIGVPARSGDQQRYRGNTGRWGATGAHRRPQRPPRRLGRTAALHTWQSAAALVASFRPAHMQVNTDDDIDAPAGRGRL
jgi:hypothetical protein